MDNVLHFLSFQNQYRIRTSQYCTSYLLDEEEIDEFLGIEIFFVSPVDLNVITEDWREGFGVR